MPLDEMPPDQSSTPNLLAADDVLPDLLAWRRGGLKTALVTLVGIDGATPRPLGAQMAVAEDGRYAGYLSGGCLEQAVAIEAQTAIREGCNRLVRYGKGSPYFDLKLPCGSGLDLYMDQGLDGTLVNEIARLRSERRTFWLETDVATGQSAIAMPAATSPPASAREANLFRRAHIPPVRVLLVGGGPAMAAIARLISAAGFEIEIATPDDATRRELSVLGIEARPLVVATDIAAERLDRWSAAIVAFHEHQWEAPVLARVLRTDCFYIGALGSKAAHANRVAALVDLGVEPDAIARVRAPIGLIPGAKSRVTLAAGILAELLTEAKSRRFVA